MTARVAWWQSVVGARMGQVSGEMGHVYGNSDAAQQEHVMSRSRVFAAVIVALLLIVGLSLGISHAAPSPLPTDVAKIMETIDHPLDHPSDRSDEASHCSSRHCSTPCLDTASSVRLPNPPSVGWTGWSSSPRLFRIAYPQLRPPRSQAHA